MLVMTVLLGAFLAISQSLVGAMSLNKGNRESALAQDALREMVEVLEGVSDFDQVFRLYNSDPGDDPPGGAPGKGFAVRGLDPVDNDDDGFVGEIFFPAISLGGGPLVIREDLQDPELGMPRDLNGDGDILDQFDANGGYKLLPVLVRLRWRNGSGEKVAEIRTFLSAR
jgi:hypothetical protein